MTSEMNDTLSYFVGEVDHIMDQMQILADFTGIDLSMPDVSSMMPDISSISSSMPSSLGDMT